MFSNTPAAPAARAHDDASVEPPPRLGRVGQHRFPRVDMVAKLSTGDKPLSTARSASRGRSPTAECAGQDRRRPVLVPRLRGGGRQRGSWPLGPEAAHPSVELCAGRLCLCFCPDRLEELRERDRERLGEGERNTPW